MSIKLGGSNMRLWHLILHEIRYRKLNFAMGVLGVVVAVGCTCGLLMMLGRHDVQAEQLVAQKQKATNDMMLRMQDEMRKVSLRMGYNMMIVLKGQSLEEIYAADAPVKYMPEAYGDRLAEAKLQTINHILPALQRRMEWTERGGRKVMLNGVRGEVYVQDKSQRPILESVAKGTMVVGSELARSEKLQVGQKVTLMGREFTIAGVQPGRGSKDDVAVWINLGEAQEILHKEGSINAILALECECSEERLAAIRKEVGRILPDTEVVEFSLLANARAEMRNKAADAAKAAAAQERKGQLALRRQRQSLAKIVIPLAVVGSALWIALLALGNVRQRNSEIGILRAIGLRCEQVLLVLLGKALLMGLIGAIAGYAAGALAASVQQAAGVKAVWFAQPRLLALSLVGAPLLACAASLLPAMLAVYQDPALMLRED